MSRLAAGVAAGSAACSDPASILVASSQRLVDVVVGMVVAFVTLSARKRLVSVSPPLS